MSGTIISEENKIIPRQVVGDATDDETGIRYMCFVNTLSLQPMVCSSKTNKIFMLSWEDIIKLAIKAGIDNDEDAKKRGGS